LAAILRRFLTYGGLEQWIDPLAPAAVEPPPSALIQTYRHFLQPVKWLIMTTLVVSLIASLTELAMFGFLGSLVDRMSASTPDQFVADNLGLLVIMGLVVLLARPFFAIWSRALVNLSITPSLSSLVRWRSYRYVLRQSLGFFQDDYADASARR
jgi:ATP-binding cassette subfamily B multidrug efflux pump